MFGIPTTAAGTAIALKSAFGVGTTVAGAYASEPNAFIKINFGGIRVTKHELQQYVRINKEAEQLREQITRIRSQMESPKGQIITDMPGHTATFDRVGIAYTQLDSVQNHYLLKLSELCGIQLKIEIAIERLTPLERTMMRYRYLDGLTWEKICVKMNYEWRQIHYIHSRALKNIA